jgi:hypothetical protein
MMRAKGKGRFCFTQNFFDEWGVRECLELLVELSKLPIESGEHIRPSRSIQSLQQGYTNKNIDQLRI